MKDIIWGAVGLLIALGALVYLISQLALNKNGVQTEGEIISVVEKKKGTFIHTVRYTYKGKEMTSDDRAGFSQPMSIGTKKMITVDKRKPENFEYTDELKKNITITLVMIGVAVIFSLKWLISGLK